MIFFASSSQDRIVSVGQSYQLQRSFLGRFHATYVSLIEGGFLQETLERHSIFRSNPDCDNLTRLRKGRVGEIAPLARRPTKRRPSIPGLGYDRLLDPNAVAD
jgi:hypothetical protein